MLLGLEPSGAFLRHREGVLKITHIRVYLTSSKLPLLLMADFGTPVFLRCAAHPAMADDDGGRLRVWYAVQFILSLVNILISVL